MKEGKILEESMLSSKERKSDVVQIESKNERDRWKQKQNYGPKGSMVKEINGESNVDKLNRKKKEKPKMIKTGTKETE